MGPGESLFTSRFYQGIAQCLDKDGVFVAQNGVSFMQMDEVTTSHQRLTPCFKEVTFYAAAVPTYVGGIMTFAWATQNPELQSTSTDDLLQRQLDRGIKTNYYRPAVHQASFALPAYVIDAIEAVSER